MNMPDIIQNLYTNLHSNWITDIDENEEQIQPYIIQKWLVMNDKLRVQVRWLDKYVFTLPPKMYLSLAWSIMPKVGKVPFTPYIKAIEDTEDFDFILNKIRQHYQMSDNDFKANKSRLIKAIRNDMASWFSFYGVEKEHWKKYNVRFDLIKGFDGGDKQCQL